MDDLGVSLYSTEDEEPGLGPGMAYRDPEGDDMVKGNLLL
jgi:hypothetical protein